MVGIKLKPVSQLKDTSNTKIPKKTKHQGLFTPSPLLNTYATNKTSYMEKLPQHVMEYTP